jgi:hypothetical protein
MYTHTHTHTRAHAPTPKFHTSETGLYTVLCVYAYMLCVGGSVHVSIVHIERTYLYTFKYVRKYVCMCGHAERLWYYQTYIYARIHTLMHVYID